MFTNGWTNVCTYEQTNEQKDKITTHPQHISYAECITTIFLYLEQLKTENMPWYQLTNLVQMSKIRGKTLYQEVKEVGLLVKLLLTLQILFYNSCMETLLKLIQPVIKKLTHLDIRPQLFKASLVKTKLLN